MKEKAKALIPLEKDENTFGGTLVHGLVKHQTLFSASSSKNRDRFQQLSHLKMVFDK
jgi:hypothetical protein